MLFVASVSVQVFGNALALAFCRHFANRGSARWGRGSGVVGAVLTCGADEHVLHVQDGHDARTEEVVEDEEEGVFLCLNKIAGVTYAR